MYGDSTIMNQQTEKTLAESLVELVKIGHSLVEALRIQATTSQQYIQLAMGQVREISFDSLPPEVQQKLVESYGGEAKLHVNLPEAEAPDLGETLESPAVALEEETVTSTETEVGNDAPVEENTVESPITEEEPKEGGSC